ncbi:matrix metalloproteinase-14 [Elysia marginata]|uniref:Matrix metalloproteinase-14 n=1 Tax=Elysia marginata TaxID=1093978 RepID=A0AAV4HP19_9GAST|nr:matrix metalloproteinase-14 [Elysia marginata]
MAPFYRGYQKDFRLDPDDVKGIQELYGKPINHSPRRHTPGSRTPAKDSEGPKLSVPRLCVEPKIDAMFTGSGHDTFIFKGHEYYKIEPWGIAKGYPRLISEDWYPLKGPIDSALYWSNGYTYLFKGSLYYKFYGRKFKYSRSIRSGFMGIPDNVDASFVWGKNKVTYFMKGNQYWRYSTNQADPEYPKPLRMWGRGMPARVDAAVRWRNDKTYFFREESYYRYNDYDFMVEDSYPRPTAQWWLGCPDKDEVRHINQIQDLNGDPEKPVPDLKGGQSDYQHFPGATGNIQWEMSTDSALGELDQSEATMETPLESSDKELEFQPDSVESRVFDEPGFRNNSRNFSTRLSSFSSHVVLLQTVFTALVSSLLVHSGS